jgi:hypothetical protein
MAGNSTQATAAGILGIYSDPTNPYVKFVTTTDLVAKQAALMEIQRQMSGPGQGGYATEFQAMQAMLRKAGLSKSTTPLGIVGIDEMAALDKVIAAAIPSQLSPLAYLANYNSSLKPKTIAQPDMATQYTKQVQSALQYKDLGDARQAYSDSYFKAFGQFPAPELDKKFQDSWNAQVKSQTQATTTEQKTEKVYLYDTKSKPVIDKATGKQKVDLAGQKVYTGKLKDDSGVYRTKSISTGTSKSMGEGFTAEEQTQFLADFLVQNFPDAKFNVKDIGGTAKTIYDTIAAYNKGNYEAVPDFATVAPLIKNIMSHPDEKVQAEMFNQYVGDLQKKSSGRFMAIQGMLQPGENANKYVDPVLKSLGNALETTLDIKDPLALQALNFKDDKGNYRLPNDFELSQMVMNDKRYGTTSSAINTAINMGQSLQNALR